MNTNINYAVENEKFLFLFNDLTAAQWVLNIDVDISNQLMIECFMDVHEVFLKRLSRIDKGIFSKVNSHELSDVIRGWIRLYKCTLELLKKQYPRSSSSRDLIIGRVNWSEKLDISASGLLLIDHSSRYAEYWAERSIKTADGYSSLDERLLFVGSYIYNSYAQMVHRGDLLVLDAFSNGVTSYDMMLFFQDNNSCSPENFCTEIGKLGWRLEVGDEFTILNLFQLYSMLYI